MTSDAFARERERIVSAQVGDTWAREEIIHMHQPLIWMLAKRLNCEWMSCEDLVQAGNVGLLYALYRYNPKQEAKLSTYAVPWVLGEMRKAMRRAEVHACSLDEASEDDQQSLYDVIVGCSGVDIGQIDLNLALSRLEKEEKLLICLRYFQDKTQKEAAYLLGKSQTQISRIERRALDRLQAMLTS